MITSLEELENVASRGEFNNKKPYFSRNLKGREEYDRENVRLFNLFKSEVIRLLGASGITDAKMQERIFEQAWGDGHSEGYANVVSHVETFVYVITGHKGTTEN